MNESSGSILSMRGIDKSFGGVRALRSVNLEVRRGEVHALIGENGAGKSTLMKVLSGAIRADSGEIYLNGEPYRPRDPLQARRLGISMVYQELTLAPHLTVEENIMLGIETSRAGFIQHGVFRDRVQKVLETLRHPELSPETRVKDLSAGCTAACGNSAGSGDRYDGFRAR